MKEEDAKSFNEHARARTLRFEGHEFHAGQKQLLVYKVRRSGKGQPGTAEAEVHVHLAHNGNGRMTGANIRWVGDKPHQALDMDIDNEIVDVCTSYYFPDSTRRAMSK